MTTLFISDLHLDPARPDIEALFHRFLAGPARQAEALYILGDLFETWAGDDIDGVRHAGTLAALRRLSAVTPVRVMVGNRDFLLGAGFEAATGCRLLDDPQLIDLDGVPTVLSHGDQLCTADTDYQRFRRLVRSRWLQRVYRSLPTRTRARLVGALRARTAARTQRKPAQIMDVTPAAVADLFRATGAQRLIHGHTHRPGVHALTVEGRACERIVLGDWYTQGSVLRCGAGQVELTRLPLATA